MEPVTSVLLARGHEPEGLRKMLGASLALHVVAAVAVLLPPMLWHARAAADVAPVMTVSLSGGPPGPVSGGMNPLAGRPVQTAEPAPRPEPAHPPAERRPDMTVPVAKGKPLPKAPARSEVEEGRGSTPTRGARPNVGAAFGETGVEGTGTGLSTGGLGGDSVSLDASNFCCPEYLGLMTTSIKRNWDEKQAVAGETLVKFTIRRDGTIVDVSVERPSGYWALDRSAQLALLVTKQLPPLPAQYPNDHLTVHLRFEYTGRKSP
jgi:TonB family protein